MSDSWPSRVVIDASVALKWVLGEEQLEADGDSALTILKQLRQGKIRVLQPSHWLLEVSGVLAREAPEDAAELVTALAALELPTDRSFETLRRAVEIATTLRHHVFDTFYHAVALEHAFMFVTADEKYYRKASSLGSVHLLSEFA